MRIALLAIMLSACAHPAAHWSYNEPWGGVCASGKSQSPVDLHAQQPTRSGGLHVDYKPSKAHLANNGHAVTFEYDPGSFVVAGGVRYALMQLHFHHPGEHTVDGAGWAMELHLVHKSPTGALLVLAVPIRIGAANAALQPVWSDLPPRDQRRDTTSTFDAAQLLPSLRGFFHYVGSLTAPPCTEGVEWYVMQAPIELSQEQLAAYGAVVPDNHRPTQPLGDRVVSDGALE